jgi:hypothetical protein
MAWLSEVWASRLYDGANITLVVALVLGVIATGVVVWSGKQKDEYLSPRLAATTQRAAEANRLAEQEHLARVRLEDKLAGWRLSAPAQSRVIDAIRNYAGTPYDLGANPNELAFTETMDGMLTAAGWHPLIPKAQPGPLGLGAIILLDGKARVNYVAGVYLEIAPSRIPQWAPAVKALRDALEAEGIPAKATTSPNDTDTTAVHVVIGSK